MKRNYPQFFAITKVFDLDKEELVQGVSKGRTSSLRGLTDEEWFEMMDDLKMLQAKPSRDWEPKPGDVQRKKMISIARQMNWHLSTTPQPVDLGIGYLMSRLNTWCLQQKFKKPLMNHTVQELNILLSIFEEKVFASYLKDLNK